MLLCVSLNLASRHVCAHFNRQEKQLTCNQTLAPLCPLCTNNTHCTSPTGLLSALAGACNRAYSILSQPNCTAGQTLCFNQFVGGLLDVSVHCVCLCCMTACRHVTVEIEHTQVLPAFGPAAHVVSFAALPRHEHNTPRHCIPPTSHAHMHTQTQVWNSIMRLCSDHCDFLGSLRETSPLAQIMLPGTELAAAALSHYLSARNAAAIFDEKSLVRQRGKGLMRCRYGRIVHCRPLQGPVPLSQPLLQSPSLPATLAVCCGVLSVCWPAAPPPHMSSASHRLRAAV